jgi:CubicO group peptidase (beta-lactamase class C family)
LFHPFNCLYEKKPASSEDCLSFFHFSFSSIAQAQSWQDTVALIDKVFSRYTDANPGAQLAISRNGQVIYSSAHGMADLEHNTLLPKQQK